MSVVPKARFLAIGSTSVAPMPGAGGAVGSICVVAIADFAEDDVAATDGCVVAVG
jgi:hypothetical protein